ncbi:hypothetical protein [Mucilaginibacter glaciei]|uniref:Uncharacterized protein n=1 Tax=Mucilaginibacter glaciei TaxID=2772109 RepID=A0A926NRJ5_9SPHI|nr:hypothetical protein [Mucilaginibacter glaciei]MBD1393692.1 hypothetical protein [Mucilaginibacter glaciei]
MAKRLLLSPQYIIVFILSLNVGRSFGAAADSSLYLRDTIDKVTMAKRILNRDFNSIYQQNLKSSFFGQEFFQPEKTQLVADVVANFVVFNTPKSRFFFNAFTRIKIRLLATPGAPVKSPSYMPGGILYTRVNDDPFNPKFLSLGYTHHSNGVRGPTLKPDGSFNADSGKFSTNFYSFNYTTGHRTDKPDRIINRYATIGVELHSGLFGTGAAEGLAGHYGFVRVNGTFLYNLAKRDADPIKSDSYLFNNWQRIQFDFTYIADKYNDYNATNLKKRLNVSLKYYYHLPFLKDVSIMAGGGYRGQDDYNFSFQQSYGYATLGVSSGLSFLINRN